MQQFAVTIGEVTLQSFQPAFKREAQLLQYTQGSGIPPVGLGIEAVQPYSRDICASTAFIVTSPLCIKYHVVLFPN